MTSRGTGADSTHAGAEDAVVLFRGEGRRYLRLDGPCPVLVRGVDAWGEAFDLGTVLDDFRAGGLALRLPWCVAVGAKLCAVSASRRTPLVGSGPVRGGAGCGAACGAPA